MSGHTPGRWRLDGEEFNSFGNLIRIYVAHEDGGRICECFANCLVKTDEALRANARLIAAAPELLEALRELQRLAGGPVGGVTQEMKRAAMDAARAAIAKAVGP